MSESGATHCWLLTPPGAGAIGVVRVAGPEAPRIIETVFAPGTSPLPPHAERTKHGEAARRGWTADLAKRIRYGRVVDGDEVLDQAVVSLAPDLGGPAFDLCVHGGVRLIERTLALMQRQGARLSSVPLVPFLVGTRIEREALSALSVAKTSRAVRRLVWQRAHLEIHLRDLAARATTDHAAVRTAWRELIAASEAALPLVVGATVALVGLPNCGKSTVFNRLIGRRVAVATSRAGTTRDWVSAEVELRGVAVRLIDTAGCHSSGGSLERDAIARGRVVAESADVIVVIVDGAAPTDEAVVAIAEWACTCERMIVAINKIDLPRQLGRGMLERAAADSHRPALPVSARLGMGLAELVDAIVASLDVREEAADRRPALFSARQLDAARSLTPILDDDPADFARLVSACFLHEVGVARSE